MISFEVWLSAIASAIAGVVKGVGVSPAFGIRSAPIGGPSRGASDVAQALRMKWKDIRVAQSLDKLITRFTSIPGEIAFRC